jgi:hypothetical protein
LLSLKVYYAVKPLLPRKWQLMLRRARIHGILPLRKNVWPIYQKAGNAPEDWAGWPEQKKFALLLTHDVESSKGRDRCEQVMEIEKHLGFRSAFYFIPRRYTVSPSLRRRLISEGFEVGVHGLEHDGKLYNEKDSFRKKAEEINKYLKEWNSEGFSSPCMHHNLEWILDLNIRYDISTYDTDPFEPQGGCAGTIFPFCVKGSLDDQYYVEIPYTLPQDFTLFILMGKKSIDIWVKKLDWIVKHGGMVHLKTHPDYFNLNNTKICTEEYPVSLYAKLLEYVKHNYAKQYWHVLPKDMARFCSKSPKNDKTRAILKPSDILCPICRRLVEQKNITFFTSFGINKYAS